MKNTDIPSRLNGTNSSGYEAINFSLQNVLATPIGSVPGHPEFGCGIDKYLFEMIDPLVTQLIEEDIRYAVGRWEPRVEIINVEVIEDPDYNRILIKLTYTIKKDVENMEREFIYKSQK